VPWRGPAFPGDRPSLGESVGRWIEANCVVPDGDLAGEPYKLTPEMWTFLLRHYELRPDAVASRPASAWIVRRSQLVRPQKWGKGPFSAAIVCAEAAPDAPVVFDGWNAAGEPVGRGWSTPWVQITAASEDQVANIWRALLPMIELSDGLRDAVPDTGETRINLPGGGRIEPTTASARSRLGARVTFCVNDETHSWLKANGGYALADTQRRNLAGTGGRSIETTNAWDPAEESVAQVTAELVGDDVYRDMAAAPVSLSFTNKRERRRILRAVYGDSYWVDLDRVDAECEELISRGEAAQAERFFGNRIVATADTWMPPDVWDACADPSAVLDAGDEITLGFDGSRFDDATALVACRMSDGLLVPLGIWSKPDGPAGMDWEVDHAAVDAAVAAAFERYTVLFFYADPPFWQDSLGAWAQEFGTEIVREWWTNRDRAMVAALERFATAVHTGELRHNGDAILAQHVKNARRKVSRSGVQIRKDRPGSARKIDAAVAAVVAFEARGDAIAAGRDWLRKRRRLLRRGRGGFAD
jgi:hypothetical protein